MAEKKWDLTVEIRTNEIDSFCGAIQQEADKVETHGASDHMMVIKFRELINEADWFSNMRSYNRLHFIATRRQTDTSCEALFVMYGRETATCDALDHLPAVVVHADGKPDQNGLESARRVISLMDRIENQFAEEDAAQDGAEGDFDVCDLDAPDDPENDEDDDQAEDDDEDDTNEEIADEVVAANQEAPREAQWMSPGDLEAFRTAMRAPPGATRVSGVAFRMD